MKLPPRLVIFAASLLYSLPVYADIYVPHDIPVAAIPPSDLSGVVIYLITGSVIIGVGILSAFYIRKKRSQHDRP